MSRSTIMLTLAGALQSWGDVPTMIQRRSGLYPTKSAVLGIVAGAMGRPSGGPVEDLNTLSMAVRVDSLGAPLTDFQTYTLHKEGRPRNNQTSWLKDRQQITHREYRNEAVYLAFLTGDASLVEEAHEALLRPVYAPFLGRRAAVPSRPVYAPNSVIHEGDASALISSITWAAPRHMIRKHREGMVDLTVVRDARSEEIAHGEVMDMPLDGREYASRSVIREVVSVPVPSKETLVTPRHRKVTHNEFLTRQRDVLSPSVLAHDPIALINTIQ